MTATPVPESEPETIGTDGNVLASPGDPRAGSSALAGNHLMADVVVADLDDLALDLGSDFPTAASITMLRRDLRLAVRSFVGFTITLTAPGLAGSVALNVLDEPLDLGHPGDSTVIPLPMRRDGSTASVTLYAEHAGAFDDLRAGIAERFDAPLTASALPAGVVRPGITGLTSFVEVHQALGLLLNAGHTPATAGVELIRRGHITNGGIPAAARALLGARTGGDEHRI